jgi:hypothetical protein
MRKIILYLLISVFLTSCRDDQKNNIQEKITFDIPFSYSGRLSGTYFNTFTNEELIYIAEPVTQKEIFFYGNDGLKKDSIPLKAILTEVAEIEAISFISPDSIVLFGLEKIALINKKGEIKLINDLKRFSANSKGDLFSFRFSNLSNFADSNKEIVINTYWKNNINNDNLEKYKIGSFESFEFYYTNFHQNPYLVSLDNYLTDSISATFSKKNTYKDFHQEDYAILEGFYSKQIKDEVFVFSQYSDLVLKLDATTMECIEKFKIKSDYTNIGVVPLKVKNGSHINFGKVMSKKLQSEGSIFDLLFDESENKFYLIVCHDFKIKEGQSTDYRPFSIIFLTKKFEKIKEINFEYGTHSPYYCMITKKGLLVLNKYENEEDPKIFSVYK